MCSDLLAFLVCFQKTVSCRRYRSRILPSSARTHGAQLGFGLTVLALPSANTELFRVQALRFWVEGLDLYTPTPQMNLEPERALSGLQPVSKVLTWSSMTISL